MEKRASPARSNRLRDFHPPTALSSEAVLRRMDINFSKLTRFNTRLRLYASVVSPEGFRGEPPLRPHFHQTLEQKVRVPKPSIDPAAPEATPWRVVPKGCSANVLRNLNFHGCAATFCRNPRASRVTRPSKSVFRICRLPNSLGFCSNPPMLNQQTFNRPVSFSQSP